MRVFSRVVIGVVLAMIWLVAALLGWLYFSSAGLPDVESLSVYAPATAGIASATSCHASTPVSSADDLRPLFPALYAAEGSPKDGHYSELIARNAFCSREKNLTRELKEIRLALQIRRRYTDDERLTIFLNLANYGGNQSGIYSASQTFFGVTPQHLDLAQSALLMGLIVRPYYYSPTTHPERALARRNAIIEKMKALGSLSAIDTANAEASPLELK